MKQILLKCVKEFIRAGIAAVLAALGLHASGCCVAFPIQL